MPGSGGTEDTEEGRASDRSGLPGGCRRVSGDTGAERRGRGSAEGRRLPGRRGREGRARPVVFGIGRATTSEGREHLGSSAEWRGIDWSIAAEGRSLPGSERRRAERRGRACRSGGRRKISADLVRCCARLARLGRGRAWSCRRRQSLPSAKRVCKPWRVPVHRTALIAEPSDCQLEFGHSFSEAGFPARHRALVRLGAAIGPVHEEREAHGSHVPMLDSGHSSMGT